MGCGKIMSTKLYFSDREYTLLQPKNCYTEFSVLLYAGYFYLKFVALNFFQKENKRNTFLELHFKGKRQCGSFRSLTVRKDVVSEAIKQFK